MKDRKMRKTLRKKGRLMRKFQIQIKEQKKKKQEKRKNDIR